MIKTGYVIELFKTQLVVIFEYLREETVSKLIFLKLSVFNLWFSSNGYYSISLSFKYIG